MEPAVGVQHLGGQLRLLVVAHHDGVALDAQLPILDGVLADGLVAHAHRRHMGGALVVVPGAVAGGLGQAVHLHDEKAVVHQIEHLLGRAGCRAAGQDAQPAVTLPAAPHHVPVDVLQDDRHGGHGIAGHQLQIAVEVAQVGAEVVGHAHDRPADQTGKGRDVEHGQDGKVAEIVVVHPHLLQHDPEGVAVGRHGSKEVLLAEHDPLAVAGGARGEHDGHQGFPVFALVDLGGGIFLVAVDGQHPVPVCLADRGLPLEVAAVVEDGAGFHQVQLIADILPALLQVEGDQHGPGEDGGKNADGVVVAVGGQHADPLALDVGDGGLQRRRLAADVVGVLPVGDLPHPFQGLVVIADGDAVGIVALHPEDQLVNGRNRDRDLSHSVPFRLADAAPPGRGQDGTRGRSVPLDLAQRVARQRLIGKFHRRDPLIQGEGAVGCLDERPDLVLGGGQTADAGADLVPLLADQDLPHRGDLAQQRFQLFGADVFAAGQDHQVVFAAGQVDIAVLVDAGQVPGVEPPVPQDGGGGLGVVVIAQHDGLPFHAQLAVLQAVLHVGVSQAHRRQVGPVLGAVPAAVPHRLGQAVGLDDGKAVVDQVGQHLGVIGGGPAGEDAQLAQAGPLALGHIVVDGLEQGGHHRHDVAGHGGQVPVKAPQVGAEIDGVAADAPGDQAGQGRNVEQGQHVEGRELIVLAQAELLAHGAERLGEQPHGGEQVALAEHDPLAAAGGVGGEEDDGQRVLVGALGQLGQLGAAGKGADVQHPAAILRKSRLPLPVQAVGQQTVHLGPGHLVRKLGPAFFVVEGDGHRPRQDAPEDGHGVGIAGAGHKPDVPAPDAGDVPPQVAHHPADVGGILPVADLPHAAGGLVVAAHRHPVGPGRFHVHHVLVDGGDPESLGQGLFHGAAGPGRIPGLEGGQHLLIPADRHLDALPADVLPVGRLHGVVDDLVDLLHHAAAGQAGHHGVERAVQPGKGGQVPFGLFHLVQQLPQAGDLPVGGPAAGDLADGPLHDPAEGQDIPQRLLPQVEHGHQLVQRRAGLRPPDEGPLAETGLQQAQPAQTLEGVAHRHPADAELGGQLVFRGELVAGLPAAGEDLFPQLVKHLLADAALDNFLDGHRRTLL